MKSPKIENEIFSKCSSLKIETPINNDSNNYLIFWFSNFRLKCFCFFWILFFQISTFLLYYLARKSLDMQRWSRFLFHYRNSNVWFLNAILYARNVFVPTNPADNSNNTRCFWSFALSMLPNPENSVYILFWRRRIGVWAAIFLIYFNNSYYEHFFVAPHYCYILCNYYYYYNIFIIIILLKNII